MWIQEDDKADQVVFRKQNPLFTIVTWRRTGQTRQLAKRKTQEWIQLVVLKKKTNLNDRDKKVKLLQYICTRMCIAPPECRPNGDPLKKHRE